jgi:hypothetical protein
MSTVLLQGTSGDGYNNTLQEIADVAERWQNMRHIMRAILNMLRHPDRIASQQSPGPSRAGDDAGHGAREPFFACALDLLFHRNLVFRGRISAQASAAQRHLHPTNRRKGATPMGDDFHMACLGECIAEAVGSRGNRAPAFASFAEIEQEYFPLLIETNETNAARRKLCAAVENGRSR